MPTWKLEIEYKGTRYHGWQIQQNARTVQGELLKAARQIFSSSEKIEIGGSGRTDAGVHALCQVAHLRVKKLQKNLKPSDILIAFNDLLPHDINLLKVENAPANFHARHDAISRYYLYQISTRRTALGKHFVWWIKDKLNVQKMKQASSFLIGKHDFSAFSNVEKGQSPLVVVEHSDVFTDGSLICFRIGASHFLWKMVRRLVGTLVEVGRGNLSTQDFQNLLREPGSSAKFTAPSSGLFLEKVLYEGDKPPNARRAIIPIQ
jgi:tRNA pseudouridine38-40 synthase